MARGYNWNAPAKLFFWPAPEGSDQDDLYPTLPDAIAAAAEGDVDAAWIVTEAGDILSPRLIAALREEVRPRRAPPVRSFFGWARAA